MGETRHAVEFTVDISDLAYEDEANEIADRIEEALAPWRPTVTYTVREYTTGEQKETEK